MLTFNNDIISIAKSKMTFKKCFAFLYIKVVYFISSKAKLSEEDIAIKDGSRNEKLHLLEEMRNESIYIAETATSYRRCRSRR